MKSHNAARITMTNSQANSEYGRGLIESLKLICHDEVIGLDEIQILHGLLSGGPKDLPAVPFLRRLTTSILLDGDVKGYEAYELRLAIKRVLPKVTGERLIPAPGKNPEPIDEDDASEDPVEEPATERQLTYIRELGGIPTPGLGQWAASDLIHQLKGDRGATNRQKMVLRFWGREDLMTQSSAAISAWLDEFYGGNPLRSAAWHLYKVESGGDERQKDPNGVPVAAGIKYFDRILRTEGRMGHGHGAPTIST
jgi:hypothetical protein